MQAYRIKGGYPITGKIRAIGTKNIASKVMVASLLTDEPVRLMNVPAIHEITIVKDLLTEIGTKIDHDADARTMTIDPGALTSGEVKFPDSGSNRIPILLLGILAHRFGASAVPVLGGCYLGERKLDFHVAITEAFGGTVTGDEVGYKCRVDGSFKGATYTLPYPSMGATETFLFLAVLAKGSSVLKNAAFEPEVFETISFLRSMGAIIHIHPDREIRVEGVSELSGTTFYIVGDRMDAAAWACAACATDGSLEVSGIRPDLVGSFLPYFTRAGGGVEIIGKDALKFFRKKPLEAIHLETDVAPGFATDWQQPFTTMLSQATGVSIIHDTVYDDRFKFLEALKKLGVTSQVSTYCLGPTPCRFRDKDRPHSAIVTGPSKLTPIDTPIDIPDLRGGLAYVIAALLVPGTTTLTTIGHVERGFGDLTERLKDTNIQMEKIELDT